MIIEICCNSLEKALSAQQAGAGRIELCVELAVGGVTPPRDLMEQAFRTMQIPVHVLVRPRSGDFRYTPEEVGQMLDTIRQVGELSENSRAEGRNVPRDGVVIGALDGAGEVDAEVCRRLIRLSRTLRLSVTFHRAIDVAKDPLQAFRDILPLGVDRVLSSGGAASAYEGRKTLARMQEITRAEHGPVLMPGAGVTAANVGDILRATGASEIHGSRIEIIRGAALA